MSCTAGSLAAKVDLGSRSIPLTSTVPSAQVSGLLTASLRSIGTFVGLGHAEPTWWRVDAAAASWGVGGAGRGRSSRYQSLTVHGDREEAQTARERWAAKVELVRSAGRARPGITIAVPLRESLGADHGWRPSTMAGYRSVVGFLDQDPVAVRRVVDLTPALLAAVCTSWRSQGWPDPTVSSRIDPGAAFCSRLGLRGTHRGSAPAGRDARPAAGRCADARTGGPCSGNP